MRRINIFFLLLFIVTFFNSAMSQHAIFYSNEEDGYSFEYPETWKRADEFDGKLSLVALAPEETEAEDGVREQLHVAIFDMKGKNKQAFYQQYMESHKTKNRSWKQVEDGELLGRKTKALYFACFYSNKTSGKTQGEMVYVYAKEGKAYVLTCTTSYDEIDSYKSVFNNMAKSFSFDTAPEE